MLGLGPHSGFIIAAYAMTAVVVAGLIVWAVLDGRTLKQRIAALEARGVRRRSDLGPRADLGPRG